MSVIAGVIAPHPPLLIPEIGGADIRLVYRTAMALKETAETLDALAPDALVFVSPHGPSAGAAFNINGGATLTGTFGRFGFPDKRVSVAGDTELAGTIAAFAARLGIAVLLEDGPGAPAELDWGVLVPYHFVGGGRPIAVISISSLGSGEHFNLGKAIAAAAEHLGRRVAFIASGDLSHRLSPGSPYGFSPAGPEFDRIVVDICAQGTLSDLQKIDPEIASESYDCGSRSFLALAGALDKRHFQSRVLSYEGPFGVGYLVANFILEDKVRV